MANQESDMEVILQLYNGSHLNDKELQRAEQILQGLRLEFKSRFNIPKSQREKQKNTSNYILTTKFVREININTGFKESGVALEVHIDPISGGCFAIEAGFIDQVTDVIYSPYNILSMLKLAGPQ